MTYETRQVNPGKQHNTGLKLAILQYGGMILREESLWLYVSWTDEEAARRFEEARAHPLRVQERKMAS
jgi:hypothetical protein